MIIIKNPLLFFKDLRERLIHIEGKLDEIKNSKMNYCKEQQWGGVTYSQFGDDLVVLNIFNNLKIKNFTYLDIGAHHPYNISNTALLYKYGHHGINVEANPNLIEAFFRERPLDKNVNVGVGTENGEMPFYLIDECSGRNSFNKEVVEKFCKENPVFSIKEIKQIKVLTLYELINKYADGKFPDFLSIDIEGWDAKVLSQIIPENAPMVIDVEIHSKADQNAQDMIFLLRQKGFLPYFRCNSNLIFVRQDINNKLLFNN